MTRVSVPWLKANYVKREEMVPMRDGVGLYTAIYSPASGGAAPVLMLRTPFPLKPYGPERFPSNLRKALSRFVAAGYIIVQQNVRGTYLSEGDFENVRPASTGEYPGTLFSVSEMTDTWDTAQWILENTACNGSIGVKGVSYPGFYATCAAMCGHPAIKAVSPQAPVTDWFMGDDLHHNGALMLADTYYFGRFFFRKRPHPGSRVLPTRHIGRKDVFRFFLKMGPMSRALAPMLKKKTFWRDIAAHPDYDGFWQERNAAAALGSYYSDHPEAPAMLVVGGTFDAEDLYGPLRCFDAVKDREDCFMVLGPWGHGSWGRRRFDRIGDAFMGKGLSARFMDRIEFPFFEHCLRGAGRLPKHKVTVFTSVGAGADEAAPNLRKILKDFQAGAASKAGDGKSVPEGAASPAAGFAFERSAVSIVSDLWPLKGSGRMRLMLEGDRSLSIVPASDGSLDGGAAVAGGGDGAATGRPGSMPGHRPDGKPEALSYLSDPARPVPSCRRGPAMDRDYMAADQRFLSRRKDVLSFRSGRLDRPVTAIGAVRVSLSVAIGSDDADVLVKLIDVRPDGYQMPVRGGILPLRYRRSFSVPEPMRPGVAERVEFTLNDIAHVFLPGHRMMVQVQSSCFPLFAINPQTFIPNQYEASVSDYRAAEVTLHTSPASPSFLEVDFL